MDAHPLPVTFALVEPSEPGNVGAAARSLAAFGFGDLVLIEPRRKVSPKDRTLAVRIGRQVLRGARVWSEADFIARAAGYDEIWGTSARDGRRRRPTGAREMVAGYLAQEPKRILLLFGPERDGLRLVWLDRCHRLVRLPTREGCPLNLAQAVSVCAYELRTQLEASGGAPADAPAEETARAAAAAGGDVRAIVRANVPAPRESRLPGDALAVSLRDRQELLRRAAALLAELDYPSRALHGHPPSAYLQPLRGGAFSQGQARWLLGLFTRIERRLGMRPAADDACKGSEPPSAAKATAARPARPRKERPMDPTPDSEDD